MAARIALNQAGIAAFCERNRILKLSLFGSVLREDFDDGSDVDVLVEFDAAADWSLLDVSRMQRELGELLGRQVDLGEPRRLSKYIRRRVLDSAEIVYVRR